MNAEHEHEEKTDEPPKDKKKLKEWFDKHHADAHESFDASDYQLPGMERS